MPDLAKPSRVTISEHSRVLDLFFKVDDYAVSHERLDGAMSEPRSTLVFERGDAVGALLYDPERRKIITVRQFRLPVHLREPGRGWMVEAVAGMLNTTDGGESETPYDCVMRETQEETGYQLTRLTPVGKYYSSPGGSTEIIHLYYAEVRTVDQTEKGGGNAAEGEDIEIVEFAIDEFFDRLVAGEFQDPKLIIAGQWLMARRGNLAAEYDTKTSRTFVAELNPRQTIGIKTGNISAIKDVEAWVNSENTDMQMDRFFRRSVSATIRVLGAKKHEGSTSIQEDTIGLALTKALGGRNFVTPGTVLETEPGELEKTHNVQRIFHVASVAGDIGTGLSTTLANIERSIDNVLAAISKRRYRSALIPLFGTGQGGFPVSEVVPVLVKGARDFFAENPKSPLREIYFVAYSEGDLARLKNEIRVVTGVTPVEVKAGE
ncbi:NUDIX hydrolase [Rhodomicrobium vannielii ATCC 17100]|uniref:GDP-mannose pyrophosphatase n=1 Tax=Rhodomicrobium vannielii (strain ATCC 17100 / DSM 162 / LMG 4299 / NCIMB 10020 / ATH 3.1.1) TaxID=648757 RepID=E3I610_RHOVT|nr:NUDIX domain-containing protein [Rhodomicrobium vannielii]ADP70603.1 NUDIX hydrolase [Rhodomicrobium vannielii ATCC 17100]